ncbi:hypothetical protein AC249_AIPGENE19475, partial [Exaiptasia diaphana]
NVPKSRRGRSRAGRGKGKTDLKQTKLVEADKESTK